MSVEELLRTRHAVEEIAKDEKKKWLTIDAEYDFRPAISREELRERSLQKQREGKKVIGLDLMGYGSILRSNVSHNGGLAVALSDMRLDWNKRLDKSYDNTFLAGDILSKKTWSQIHEWLQTQQIKPGGKFDFVYCRPLQGLDYLTTDPGIYMWLLQQAYNMLTDDRGLLITEVPHADHKLLKKWVPVVNKSNGLQAKAEFTYLRTKLHSPLLRIDKNQGAPALLPTVNV